MALFALKVRTGSNSKSNIGRERLEADEIPPYSSSSNMNVAGDIAQLSYKELQALALRYRVPGNIKVRAVIVLSWRSRRVGADDTPASTGSLSVNSTLLVPVRSSRAGATD